MKLAAALICLVLVGCKSAAPDASLFREHSQEWQDGYQAGIIEGVLLTKD